MVIVAVWRYLIRRRKRRIEILRRPSLVYQSIDAIECQQICPQRRDYANVSIANFPHRSGTTKPQLGLAESDEDYLEPKQIESKSASEILVFSLVSRFQLVKNAFFLFFRSNSSCPLSIRWGIFSCFKIT